MAEILHVHDGESQRLLEQRRLLTEVDHLLAGRLPDGSIEPDTELDVTTNLRTAVLEIAMPYAVSRTFQRAKEVQDEAGRRRRILTWLGRSAVAVAESGYEYHFSPAGRARVGVEVAEAAFAESHLRQGTAQVFISPRMSPKDASPDIAKREHLHDDDAIRVSRAVVDTTFRVMGRSMESLLVRDIPLAAWVSMLRDPQNIFGRAFAVRDEESALSVMELFEHFEVPEDRLPEGPVTLVAAVVPYITDEAARASVERQLVKFRGDQALYAREASARADDWFAFDRELAESLFTGEATLEVERFIITLQDDWSDEDLELITGHEIAGGRYAMSRELAARLEAAKRNLLNSQAAIVTGNEKVLEQMDEATRTRIQDRIEVIGIMRASGVDEWEIHRQQTMLNRDIAGQNFKLSGGCPGEVEAGFRGSGPDQTAGGSGGGENGDKKRWQWKSGVCRVPSCPSPKPTEVGPCSVCRHCQGVYDAGGDPTKSRPRPKPPKRAAVLASLLGSKVEREVQSGQPEASKPKAAGRLVLAGALG